MAGTEGGCAGSEIERQWFLVVTWGDEDRFVLHTAPFPKDALLHLK
jgi:hypothetical protein